MTIPKQGGSLTKTDIKYRTQNMKQNSSSGNKIFLNDFFDDTQKNPGIPSFIKTQKQSLKGRRFSQKWQHIRDLNITKLKKIKIKNVRYFQTWRPRRIQSSRKEKILKTSFSQQYSQLQKDSSDNTIKYQISRLRKRLSQNRSYTSYQNQQPWKNRLKSPSNSIKLKYFKQQLLSRTICEFQSSDLSNYVDNSHFMDFPVQIHKSRIFLEPKSTKLQYSSSRIHTRFRSSHQNKVKTQPNQAFQNLCRWNHDQQFQV